MYWLSIGICDADSASVPPLSSQGSDKVVRLPCPTDALLEIAALDTVRDRQRAVKQIHRSLRLNPSLLLFAMAEFTHWNGRRAKNAEHLVGWCVNHLQARLADQPFEQYAFEMPCETSLQAFFDGFFRVRSHKKLKRSLREWMCFYQGPLQSGVSQKTKRLIQQVVGKQFRADQFICKRLRRPETAKRSIALWANSTFVNSEISKFFIAAVRLSATEADYQRRLESEKLAAMKQLAYGASHEINNPLANVATRAQTMLQDESHPEKRNKLSVIYQQAMRAHEMISDLMLFAHPPALKTEQVSLRLLMSRFLRSQKTLLNEHSGIRMTATVGAGLDRVNLDRHQIVVALANLVRNSCEAIAAKGGVGKIEVRIDGILQAPAKLELEEKGASVEALQISVTDNGVGVDAHVRQHLFDPFFSGREAGRGLGFGLSKVWRIVELHGGRIFLDDAYESGTRFVIQVPQKLQLDGPTRKAKFRLKEIQNDNTMAEPTAQVGARILNDVA